MKVYVSWLLRPEMNFTVHSTAFEAGFEFELFIVLFLSTGLNLGSLYRF
jgi:hypothetical protein